MKRTALLFLLALFSLSALSQSKGDSLAHADRYFIVVNRNNENRKQTLSKGDKIAVKLRDHKKVYGKILDAGPDFILIEKKGRIEVANIKWIRKSKPSPERLTGGLLLTATGVTLLFLTQSVSFDIIAAVGISGIACTIGGIAILVPPKYKLHKGDKLMYIGSKQ